MTFPSNDTERVLAAAAEGRTGMQSFLRTLVDGEVFLSKSAFSDAGLTLATTTIDSRAYIRVYTSDEQALAGGEEGSVEVAARGLIRSMPSHVGFALNVGGDLGLPVFAETLQQSVNGSSTLSTGSRIRIGDPVEEPNDLLQALSDAYAGLPAIRAARRCWAAVNDEQPGLVVGIDLDPDTPDTRSIVQQATSSTVSTLAPSFVVDLVFTTDRDEFTNWMIDNSPPFHTTKA
jgi:hypothetical protein